MDPEAVTLFRSPVACEADEALHFESNRVVARVADLARPIVRQAAGVGILTYALQVTAAQ